MATTPVIKIAGLHSSNNDLDSAPVGALEEATNIIVPFMNVAQSRRGQKYVGQNTPGASGRTFGVGGDRSKEGVFYRNVLITQYAADKLARDPGSGNTYSDFAGSYTPPDAALLRMKFMESAQNLYFNCADGTRVLESPTGTPAQSGIPAALRTYAFNESQNGTWQTYRTSVSYVAIWGRKDANGNVKLGRPSQRFVLQNRVLVTATHLTRTAPDGSHPAGKVTGFVGLFAPHFLRVGDVLTLTPGEGNFAVGAKTIVTIPTPWTFTYDEAGANVSSTLNQDFQINRRAIVWVDVPPGVSDTSGHFLQLYRSFLSPVGVTDPGDEVFQVYEVKPTPTDVANGYVAIDDLAPEGFQAGPAYTNPDTGDGIENANDRPPVAKDICEWQGRAFYFNTTDKHRMFLSILGVGTPDGVQDNDTLFIAGRTYTFQDPAVAGAENVTITTLGSPAQNVEGTARELCNVINRNASNTLVNAFYASGKDDAPGKILIEERGVGGSAFIVYASRIKSFSPALTTGSTGAQASDNSRRKNGFSYSKVGEPEAVPLKNFRTSGHADQEILRGVPLRDKLFLFMQSGKIYTVSGQAPFRVDELDATAVLYAPDTAVPHANQIFALTSQGVVSISDAGVAIKSQDIEDDLLQLFGDTLATMKVKAFAVSYESDRQYQLWLPSISTDTACTQAYVFNSINRSWTRWAASRTWGRVNPTSNLLYMGEGASNVLRQERKSYSRSDYADESLPATINAAAGRIVALTSLAGVAIGDMLYQSDDVKSLITAVGPDTGLGLDAFSVQVLSTEAWALTDLTDVQKAIRCRVKWAPVTAGAPSILKQFREATLHFRRFFVHAFKALFDTEKVATETTVPLSSDGFGLAEFGNFPLGLAVAPLNRRVGVDQEHQRAAQIRVGLEVQEAWSIWALHGFSLESEASGERSSR